MTQRIGLEQLLFLLGLQIEHGAEQVAEAQRVVDTGHQLPHFGRQAGSERQRTLDQLLDAAHVGVHFDAAIDLLWRENDLRAQHAVLDAHLFGARARHAFDNDVDGLRRPRHLADDADGAVLAHRVGLGVVLVIPLQEQEDETIAGERAVDGLDRHRPIHRQRLQRQRKQQRPA